MTTYLIQLLFGATVLLLVAVIINGLLSRAAASLRHRVWTFSLLGLLALPILSPMVPTMHVPIHQSREHSVMERPDDLAGTPAHIFKEPQVVHNIKEPQVKRYSAQLASANVHPEVALRSTSGSLDIRYDAILFTIWLIGTSLLLVHLGISIYNVRKMIAAYETVSDPLLDRLRREFGIKRAIRLVQGTTGTVPFITGIFRPTIVLPPQAKDWSAAEKRAVLTHELAHVARGDLFGQLITQIVCALYWFHPLVWFAAYRIWVERESACDDTVVLRGEKPSMYADLLLELANGLRKQRIGLLGCTVAIARKNRIGQRIKAILNPNLYRTPLGRFGAAVFLCVAVAAIVLTATISPFAQTQEIQEPQVERQQERAASEGGTPPKLADAGSLGEAQDTELPTEDSPGSQQTEGDSFGGLTWLNVAGEIIAPEKVSFKKFEIKAIGRAVKEPHTGGSNDIQVHEDGTFTGSIWADYNYALFFHDPDLQWAAKPVFFSVGKESPKEKVVMQLEKGSLVEATLLDRESGKPITGMTVWFSQITEWKESRTETKIFTDCSLLQTDEKGQIKRYITPGDCRFTVDVPFISWEDGEQLYNIDFTVKSGTEAKPVLKIPPPFVGQALDENDEPVADARVAIHGRNNDFLYTNTDKDGFFKRRTAPKNSLVQIKTTTTRIPLSFVGWVKDELKNDEVWKVQLNEGETVTGRLLDAQTGKPLENVLLFYQYENPANAAQKEYLPRSTRTDSGGYFKAVGLASGLNYRFFFVPGRTREYNGGSYGPRVELAVLKTDKPGGTTDLGDMKVDPAKAAVVPEQDQVKERIAERFREVADKVRSGEKKSMLKIFAKAEAKDALEYILKHQNEEPLASFALFIIQFEKLDEAEQELFVPVFSKGKLFSIANDPITASKPEGILTLSQLRGEKESQWNVPKDDPSQNGDWKKSPGMLNPKILDSFLKDMLKQTSPREPG